jgi:prolyl oligopeptidase
MIKLLLGGALIGAMMAVNVMADTPKEGDPYLWLEEVEGPRALAYVEGLNAASLPRLERQPGFEEDRQAILEQLNAPDRIAYGVFRGDYVYNFWQDETNIRGLIRRSPVEAYVDGEPVWETVLDIDALAEKEEANWVYKGLSCLGPEERLCMISLSPGGSDAAEMREFDLEAKAFVPGGFVIPQAKTYFDWVDEDHLLVGTDFGPGSLTQSGYPRHQRLWKRGTPLEAATNVLSVPDDHMLIAAVSKQEADQSRSYLMDRETFWSGTYYVYEPGEEPVALPLPKDADVVHFGVDGVLALMRTPWQMKDQLFPAGTLVSLNVEDAAQGGDGAPQSVFQPTEQQSVNGVSVAGDAIYVALLDTVNGSVIRLVRRPEGDWKGKTLRLPDNGSVSVVSAHGERDEVLINAESFTQPETLYYAKDGALSKVQSMPERFDASDMKTEQLFATSADGTQIPYYVIKPATARRGKEIPVWLYGYGGFEISLTPLYLPPQYQRWVQNGGAIVRANIRGGGEFGPKWHQAALLKNRHKAFEDFAAVMDDVVERRLTTPQMLGVSGGSNGGLLTGVMLTRYPEKHNATIIGVPLLDMLRYDKLLAGASWVGEYGDPDDPEMRAYIEGYSPYHAVTAATRYPEAFIFTSTKDDRVHPGHARKFAAKLAEAKQPFLYYENIEGGHASAANRAQAAYRAALELAFLKYRLFPKDD